MRHLHVFNCSNDENALMNVSFPHLEYLEVEIIHYAHKFRFEDIATLLQANPQLKSLKIRWFTTITLTTALDTIIATSLITKLIVIGVSTSNVSEKELNRFVTEHPLVEELILGHHRVTASDAINFIRQMKSLKRIEFQVEEHSEYNRIALELNNVWDVGLLIIAADDFRIHLIRKF